MDREILAAELLFSNSKENSSQSEYIDQRTGCNLQHRSSEENPAGQFYRSQSVDLIFVQSQCPCMDQIRPVPAETLTLNLTINLTYSISVTPTQSHNNPQDNIEANQILYISS